MQSYPDNRGNGGEEMRHTEPKREVIEVVKCRECCYRGLDYVCSKYDRALYVEGILNEKPDYCKVKRIEIILEAK